MAILKNSRTLLFLTLLLISNCLSEFKDTKTYPQTRIYSARPKLPQRIPHRFQKPPSKPHQLKQAPRNFTKPLAYPPIPRNGNPLRILAAPNKTPTPPPFPYLAIANRKTMMASKCPGRKNLIDDIGLLSLFSAVTSSSFGLYTIIINSMTSNNIGIISGFLSIVLWLPSTLITLLELTGDRVHRVSNLLNSFSFINAMYGFMGVFFGTADVIFSSVGETIGIISFILSVIATFPDFLNGILDYLLRVSTGKSHQSLQHFIDNYGCSVPGLFHMIGQPLYDLINELLVEWVTEKGRNEVY